MNIAFNRLPPPVYKSTNRHTRILNRLAAIASKAPRVSAARVAAAVVFKGEIISIEVNSYKTNPFQARFRKNEHAIYPHAETAAIRAATKRIPYSDLAKSVLYVCRVRYQIDEEPDQLVHGNCCPCTGCMEAIRKHKIKTVIYSNDNTENGPQYSTLQVS